MSGYDFAKLFTKLKKTDKYSYYQGVSSKALKDAIMNAEESIKSILKQKKHPRFRSRRRNPVSSYFFIKDNIVFDIGKLNKIKIPVLGEVRIRERSYLPDISKVTSGRVIKKNGKFYLSFNYETEIDDCKRIIPGLGIDLGIKSYISIYSEGLNKSFQEESYIKYDNYIKVNDKIKRIQEVISHKAEINYSRLLNKYYDKHGEEPCEEFKNILKGESYYTSNILKLQYKLNKLYEKRTNIGNDYINKLIYKLTRTKLVKDKELIIFKPEYISMEKLVINDMLKHDDSNHHLRDLIMKSKWYYFYIRLKDKCKQYGIELRQADKYFTSSKTCSCCGHKIKDLTLRDRRFHCDKCGYEEDRDINASINLCNLNKYSIVK